MLDRRLAARMQRIWENRGKAGRSGEPRAGEPRGKIAPSRMDPMDGAALWMHPHGRTDGAIQGINLIWEVPGNQPNPGRNMPQERIMAPAQMTASRYISRPRLLTAKASRRRGRSGSRRAGTVVQPETGQRLPVTKSEPAGREQPIPDPVSDPIPVLPACVPGKE